MFNGSNVRKLFVIIAILILGDINLAQEEMVLRVGMIEPFQLDPATASNDPEVIINRHVYDYLVELAPNGDLLPSLAESWTISDDRLIYTFTLVDNVLFHDGTPFNADDVVYTFNRLLEIGASPVEIMGTRPVGTDSTQNPVQEATWRVEAIGTNRVMFILDEPNEDFLYGISSRFAAIIPEGQNAPNTFDSNGTLTNVNGTGAFILEHFEVGVGATLIANENYWRGRPILDRIEFIFYDTQMQQVDAIINDEVDFIFKIPNAALPTLQFNPDITLVSVVTNTHPVIRLRADVGHIGEDIRVRQAFKHATDRELLNVLILNGLGIVGNNDPIGPVYGDLYNPQQGLAYDPERACELLESYANDFPDNEWVQIVNGLPRLEAEFFVVQAFEYPQLAEAAALQWEEACIFVDIELRRENIYYGNNEYLNVELGLTGWGTRPTAQEYLNVGYVTGAPLNESHWSNPVLDVLVEQARIALGSERAAIYNEISALFVQEGPIIVPYFTPVHGAYRNNINGIEMYPFPGRTPFYNVTVS